MPPHNGVGDWCLKKVCCEVACIQAHRHSTARSSGHRPGGTSLHPDGRIQYRTISCRQLLFGPCKGRAVTPDAGDDGQFSGGPLLVGQAVPLIFVHVELDEARRLVPAGEVVVLGNLVESQKLVDKREAEFGCVQTARFQRCGNLANRNARGVGSKLAKDRAAQAADADVLSDVSARWTDLRI